MNIKLFAFALFFISNVTYGDFAKQLKIALENQTGFHVLTVIRDLVYVAESPKYGVTQNKLLSDSDQPLNGSMIDLLLGDISNCLQGLNKPIFVVFNEYFFQEKPSNKASV